MAAFIVKGVKSQRELLYDVISGANVDTVFSWDQLTEQSGLEKKTVQSAIQGTIVLLLERDSRTLESVRGVGYRVVAASEHVRLSEKSAKRAKRQVNKGKRTLEGTRLTDLTPEELSDWERTTIRIDALVAAMRKHERRIVVLEKAMQSKSSTDDERDAKIQRLQREARDTQKRHADQLAALTEQVNALTNPPTE